MSKDFTDGQREFYAKLEALFWEYQRDLKGDFDETDDILDGFDPEAPRMVNGLIFCISLTDGSGWTSVYRGCSPDTNHFMAIGMATDTLEFFCA